MPERFVQRKIELPNQPEAGRLKVSELMTLLDNHAYKELILDAFDIINIKDEYIIIANIATVCSKIRLLINQFKRSNIYAYRKHVDLIKTDHVIEDVDLNPMLFNFEEYVDIDEVKKNLNAYALYNSKNSFFDEYEMTKYANSLYKKNLGKLAELNLDYFKDLANKNKRFNKYKSYRLVENKGEVFVRGITSTDKYFEYGIEFTFVVAMLLLHLDMKENEGNNYAISSAAASESKLEVIVAVGEIKDAGEFGKVRSAIYVSTNDLGQGSLNFTKIIKIGGHLSNGLYLFPKTEADKQNKLIISHSTGPSKALASAKELKVLLNDTDDFISDLKQVKSINKPDELRNMIYLKMISPRSPFKEIHELKDIFKTVIANELKDFAKLLEMCNKAEDLEIDYDLKDKLRYIISDIILAKKK